MALRIEKAFGVDMETLLRMQAWYDTHAMRSGKVRSPSSLTGGPLLSSRAEPKAGAPHLRRYGEAPQARSSPHPQIKTFGTLAALLNKGLCDHAIGAVADTVSSSAVRRKRKRCA